MTSTADSSTYDSKSEMFPTTNLWIILAVKNCEVTTTFPYKVMETAEDESGDVYQSMLVMETVKSLRRDAGQCVTDHPCSQSSHWE